MQNKEEEKNEEKKKRKKEEKRREKPTPKATWPNSTSSNFLAPWVKEKKMIIKKEKTKGISYKKT